MQDAHGSLKELCANSEKDNQHLADKLKKLESAQKNLANSNNQLLQAREKITKEKTEMEKEMACLKDLEATDKSELDLQNKRFKSAIDEKFMVTPLKSLRLPIGHPLVEILCKLSLKDKPAFNEESPINFKKKCQKKIKSSSSKR
ncbi:hypothetical protein HpHA249_02460 [Helicobacter pylori]